tara:strand:- start:2354 stop:3241 length:888 start_codon:yes stop_codon:yes gene_type:complete
MKNSIYIDILKEKNNFNNYFKKLLSSQLSTTYLEKVMEYSALNGGKRIRPYLVKQFSLIKKIRSTNYNRVSSAIEIIHSYSLIHDDLPSMDNDDYRRGKLSAHKKYNEAQAILAGDSLHDLAFEILADKKTCNDTKIRIEIIKYLSKSIGSKGLAGGQSLDLIYEKKKVNINEIKRMYLMKTGALFRFCCISPLMIANSSKKEIAFASDYGNFFGLIFQIVDDFIDINGNKNNIGKTPGKDIKQMKSTFANYYKDQNIKKVCFKLKSNFYSKHKYYLNKWKKLDKILDYLISQLN